MDTKRSNFFKIFYSCVGLMLLMLSTTAKAVVIGHDTIITTPTTYSNTTVDLSNGNFIVRVGASLTIENCTIIGSVSPLNPNLISVEWGDLTLTNNTVNLSAAAIVPTPRGETSFYAVRLGRASANISGNTFAVDKQFSVGLINSTPILPVKNTTIANNKFTNFHGVIYLLNSFNTKITGNTFKMNSGGNVVLVGNDAVISNNDIYFSGLNEYGDAITLVDAEKVNVAGNMIFTPTSEAISTFLSREITIDNNTVTGGITYGVHLFSNAALKASNNVASQIVAKLGHRHAVAGTADITITNNYFGQNRYGIAAEDVTNLTVTGNFFTQRFLTAAARKFWTDNDVLLVNVVGLTWLNNTYKEAFTQVNKGDNSMTQFVVFPAHGGVVL